MDTKKGLEPKGVFNLGEGFTYMGNFREEEHIRKGYICEEIDLGLDPEEMAQYKAEGEDRDEGDKY